MTMCTYLSIITFNVNGLNAPMKRQRVAEWVKKNKTHLHAAFRRLTSDLKTYSLRVKEQKKVFHANGNKTEAGVAILVSNKIDFKTNTITKDNKGYYIMMKG